ncbi:phosphotransferase family protein [Bacillaceae bacterium S4-13-58]
MTGLEHILGEEWTIYPAGGSTGEAYYAQNDGKRLFLKRNSSPFLAVLSAEGIVPKLVWTKRLENGDVITAQHWLEGRELSIIEMQHPSVAKMLSRIHHSSELVHLFMRMGKTPLHADAMLHEIQMKVRNSQHLYYSFEVRQALKWLEERLPYLNEAKYVVCHSDMNHNNWLLADNGQLYLIDWDNAVLADPAMDIGMLLNAYIPEDQWGKWIETYYQTKLDHQLLNRIYWYVMAQTISFLLWHERRNEKEEAKKWLLDLKKQFVKQNIIQS